MQISKDPEQIRARLLEVISGEILETDASFDAQSNLFEAGLDSMATMQLLLKVEQLFGVQIPPGEMTQDNFSTVDDLARIVGKLLQGGQLG